MKTMKTTRRDFLAGLAALPLVGWLFGGALVSAQHNLGTVVDSSSISLRDLVADSLIEQAYGRNRADVPLLSNLPTEPGVYECGFNGVLDGDVAVVYCENDKLMVRINDAVTEVENFYRFDRANQGFFWGNRITDESQYTRIAEQFKKERDRVKENKG